MRRRNPPLIPQDALSGEDELTMLFSICARILAKSSDKNAFLDWIADAGPALAPDMAALVDPRAGPAGQAFRAIGVEIYNAMPVPDADFGRLTGPRPGRNAPCDCGSGRKYKHCCLALAGILDLSHFNMLRFMLDNLPKKVFTELPSSAVDMDMVWDTAMQWADEGDLERATALLEPWFAGGRALTGKLIPLFEQLMNCYLGLGRERKRERLLADVIARGDGELRSAAMQRRAAILTDRGEIDAAWTAFHAAQQENPDDPGLALLEITLLVSSGDGNLAQERARFWVARMQRSPHPDQELIGFLREIADDPVKALADVGRDMHPDVDRLAQLFAAAPPIKAYYGVGCSDAGNYLMPDRKITALESSWRGVFPQIKPPLTSTQHNDDSVWDEAPAWLDFLEKTPPAWQSFDILDDLVMALDVLAILGIDTILLEPLLERGTTLLVSNLAAAKAEHQLLPWGFMENRPALRLLAHRAFRDLHGSGRGTVNIEAAERLIALNPHDNHGVREYLTRTYLVDNMPEKTIALCEQFPNDFCSMTLNRLLALYRLGRLDEAFTTLRTAAGRHSVAIKMLLAANPKQPRVSGFGIMVGGKEEAWEYRIAHRALWEQDGALEWLRAQWRKLPKQSK